MIIINKTLKGFIKTHKNMIYNHYKDNILEVIRAIFIV